MEKLDWRAAASVQLSRRIDPELRGAWQGESGSCGVNQSVKAKEVSRRIGRNTGSIWS